MEVPLPRAANQNQIYIGDSIVTNLNIHNFQYFLNELLKNLDVL